MYLMLILPLIQLERGRGGEREREGGRDREGKEIIKLSEPLIK